MKSSEVQALTFLCEVVFELVQMTNITHEWSKDEHVKYGWHGCRYSLYKWLNWFLYREKKVGERTYTIILRFCFDNTNRGKTACFMHWHCCKPNQLWINFKVIFCYSYIAVYYDLLRGKIVTFISQPFFLYICQRDQMLITGWQNTVLTQSPK